MKRLISVLCVLCITLSVNTFGSETSITKTNLANISVLPAIDSEQGIGYIQYGDGSKENIKDGYTGLFINGSIIENTEIIIENSRALVPVRLISESFEAEVKWIPETQEINISDNSNNITFKIADRNVIINGEEITLDTSPKIVNNSTYVPLRFVSEVLGARVDYFDGEDLSKTHIIRRIPHIMVSRYDKDIKPLTKEESIKIVREQLITAYKKRYCEYEPFKEGESFEKDGDDIRKVISELNVTQENDRYYVIPVVFDFWVDKYTGDVYVFYNGLAMNINIFDPYAPGALAFAG